jgi:DNA-binding CsgD family transcriptional regulator
MSGRGRAVGGLARRLGRRSGLLAALLLLQSVAAVFFLADVIGDIGFPPGGTPIDLHVGVEAVLSVCLAIGLVFSALEMRRTLERQQRAETALSVASGAFADVLDAFFTRWALTPAERDVALMVLKGLENEQIAAARGSAVGTVRAQSTRIYAKAGVTSRSQLMSVFIEELLAERLVDDVGDDPPRMAS